MSLLWKMAGTIWGYLARSRPEGDGVRTSESARLSGEDLDVGILLDDRVRTPWALTRDPVWPSAPWVSTILPLPPIAAHQRRVTGEPITSSGA